MMTEIFQISYLTDWLWMSVYSSIYLEPFAEWPEFVKSYAPWWASHTLDWLRYGKKVHVVHFEELKKDLFVQLKSMVVFLGVQVSEDRLLCVEGQKDGNFKRSGLRKLEYDPYTPKMRATVNDFIKTVDHALRQRKLSGVPEEYRPRWQHLLSSPPPLSCPYLFIFS